MMKWTYDPHSGYEIVKRIKPKRHPAVPASRPVQPIHADKFKPLHKALVKALPDLRDGLDSSRFDEYAVKAFMATDTSDFKYWYLRSQMLKRYQDPDFSNPEVRRDAAISKLLDSETRCRFSNERLWDWENRVFPSNFRRAMDRARKEIARILGPFDWEEFPNACAFSSGATADMPRKRSSIQNKWARGTQITASALPYHLAFIRWADLRGFDDEGNPLRDLLERSLEIQEANEVFTVPKRFDVDRTACKPVTLNGFYQRGVGTMLKRRMQRRRKLLLPDAQEYHGLLAKIGSKTGALATLDCIGASDSICCSLIAALLPEDWARVVFATRESSGTLPDGTIIEWEKVSSMGNGFTFELETLVFYALAIAVCGKGSLVSLYGDDLICPTQHVDEICEVFLLAGFEMNRDKSYWDGPFRESCGGHYHQGIDVKPFYLQRMPRSLGDVINLHNDIFFWHRGEIPDGVWTKIVKECRRLVPKSYWGPYGTSGVLWAEWDDCRPVYCPDLQCFRVLSVQVVEPTQVIEEDVGGYLAQLWSKPKDEASESSKHKKAAGVEKSTCIFIDRTQWYSGRCDLLCQ